MRKALVGSLGVLLAALPSTRASAWGQGEQSVTRFLVPFSKRLMIIGAVDGFLLLPQSLRKIAICSKSLQPCEAISCGKSTTATPVPVGGNNSAHAQG